MSSRAPGCEDVLVGATAPPTDTEARGEQRLHGIVTLLEAEHGPERSTVLA